MCREIRRLSKAEREILKDRDGFPFEAHMDVVRRHIAKFREDLKSAAPAGSKAKYRTLVVSQG